MMSQDSCVEPCAGGRRRMPDSNGLQVDQGHAQLGAERLGDLVQRRQARQDVAALEPSDRRLGGTHPLRKLALAQATCLRSEEHTSELQSLMRISYAVFCLKKKKINS